MREKERERRKVSALVAGRGRQREIGDIGGRK